MTKRQHTSGAFSLRILATSPITSGTVMRTALLSSLLGEKYGIRSTSSQI